MPKQMQLSCRDVGVDCDFIARGKDENEIMRKLEEHAKKEHGMKEIPQEIRTKARKALKRAA